MAVMTPPIALTGILLDGVSAKPATPLTATSPPIATLAMGAGSVRMDFWTGGEAS